MLKITEEQAKAVRRKRADLRLSKSCACAQLNVSSKTLVKIEQGNCLVKPSVYEKVMQWLAKNF